MNSTAKAIRFQPKRLLRLSAWCLAGLLLLDLGLTFGAESLWFQEVGYLPVFLAGLSMQVGLWVLAFTLTALWLQHNLNLAKKLRYGSSVPTFEPMGQPLPPLLNWQWLFLLLLVMSALLGLLFIHQISILTPFWQWLQRWGLGSLNSPIFAAPLPTEITAIITAPGRLWQTFLTQGWLGGVLLGLMGLLILLPQFTLRTSAWLISGIWAIVLARQWQAILQFWHPVSFDQSDPLFQQDISFYVFRLSIWQLLDSWWLSVGLYALLAVTLSYLLAGNSVSQGGFPGFSRAQLRHLYGLSSLLLVAVAFRFWLQRYELLYASHPVVFGASYTDVQVRLPAYTVLTYLTLAIALVLLWQRPSPKQKSKGIKLPNLQILFSVYLALFGLGVMGLPFLVQRLIVQPNELSRETPYIRNNIALTRSAFDLDQIEVETFNPTDQLSRAKLQDNELIVRNIRLWDTGPLLKTNRQLQQIRPYYRFASADIDRYTLVDRQQSPSGRTDKQQVLIAARELDYSALPTAAQTWINRHLIYTHGYGFTMSPVNRVGPGGLPDYFVKDIGSRSFENSSPLTVTDQRIGASIPIGEPRLYYGELTNPYVLTGTKVRELDYPSGDGNVYHTYDGTGGISLGNLGKRWLFAWALRDWQMGLTRNITDRTQLLLRRNIKQRVQAIAPFLQYDQDPYLVVANPQPSSSGEIPRNTLYWVMDAYTVSDRYPYSEPNEDSLNYVRNAVKVVIDAYNGTVNFYIADQQDPLIQSWARIFPTLLQPLSAMPEELRSHIRYPVDFFQVQVQQLLKYHMTEPQVFYNREDQWQIPNEIYGSQTQPVEPYYLITKLPAFNTEEFILLLPFTPTGRPNLIAWLAARSDGDDYGKLLLYQFPKQELVYGTEQVEARINQDPVISQQISLWNRQGSRVIQGNLLVIPIEQSLLYVEPLYLEAEQNSLPTLVRVIVAYENRIAMAETLEQALDAVFQAPITPRPAVVRPVEEQP